MIHYIDKSALVAEIERRIKEYQSTGDDYWFPVIENLKSILSFLDTLEVKEVDLEKEIQRQYNVHKNPDNSIVKDCVIMTKDGFEYFAKHFFELGMSVNNKAQKGEKI